MADISNMESASTKVLAADFINCSSIGIVDCTDGTSTAICEKIFQQIAHMHRDILRIRLYIYLVLVSKIHLK